MKKDIEAIERNIPNSSQINEFKENASKNIENTKNQLKAIDGIINDNNKFESIFDQVMQENKVDESKPISFIELKKYYEDFSDKASIPRVNSQKVENIYSKMEKQSKGPIRKAHTKTIMKDILNEASCELKNSIDESKSKKWVNNRTFLIQINKTSKQRIIIIIPIYTQN